MNKKKAKQKFLKQMSLAVGVILLALLIAGLSVFIAGRMSKNKADLSQVITVSTLEKVINVSELSTFTAVYNGIAQVMNPENTEKTDYYVSYEAQVNAGFDFEKIRIEVDDASKFITIVVPKIYITDINVDISSLDFIFYNSKANGSTVTQEAFKACEADVQAEAAQNQAILELAQQNAVNVVKALVSPFVEQLYADYQLQVEQGV